jgi:hypothetical protein
MGEAQQTARLVDCSYLRLLYRIFTVFSNSKSLYALACYLSGLAAVRSVGYIRVSRFQNSVSFGPALGKNGLIGLKSGPLFLLNLRLQFQNLTFWNCLE